ncbi:hypothetical protein FQZ97_771330 [compost metagenome]
MAGLRKNRQAARLLSEGPQHERWIERQGGKRIDRHASQTAFMAGRQYGDACGELPEAAPEGTWVVNRIASLDRQWEVFHGMAFRNQTMDWAERSPMQAKRSHCNDMEAGSLSETMTWRAGREAESGKACIQCWLMSSRGTSARV